MKILLEIEYLSWQSDEISLEKKPLYTMKYCVCVCVLEKDVFVLAANPM